MKGTLEEVVEIIARILGIEAAQIEEDTAIGDLPEWDSLHHIQIITAIENKFGFRFMPDVMMDLEDVSDIVAATEERIAK